MKDIQSLKSKRYLAQVIVQNELGNEYVEMFRDCFDTKEEAVQYCEDKRQPYLNTLRTNSVVFDNDSSAPNNRVYEHFTPCTNGLKWIV